MSKRFLSFVLFGFCSLLFTPQMSLAKQASNLTPLPPLPAPVFKQPAPRITLTPYEWFIDMPLERRAKYIQRLRQFLVEQEQKKERYSFERPIFSPLFLELLQQLEQTADAQAPAAAPASRNIFPAADGTCYKGQAVPDDLSEGIQRLIQDNQDRCVIGGNVVCMVINSSKRMTCKLSDMPDTREKLRGSCGQGQIQCAYPLSVDKAKKGPLCFAEKVGLTKDCFGDKAMSSTDVAAFVKDKNLKADYDKMKSSIEKYCGPTADQAREVNYFDKTDCTQLHSWLSGLVAGESERAQAPDAVKQSFGCRFQLSGGQIAKVTVSQTAQGEKRYQAELPSGLWRAGQDNAGNVVSLTTTNDPKGYEQIALNDNSSCSVFYYKTFIGDLNIQTGKCTLRALPPSGKAVELVTAGRSDTQTDYVKFSDLSGPIASEFRGLLTADQKKMLGTSETYVSTAFRFASKECLVVVAGSTQGTSFPVQQGNPAPAAAQRAVPSAR